MRADRTADERLIDWSAVKPEYAGGLPAGILRLLGRRPNSVVRLGDVAKWFSGTPAATVTAALNDLVADGKIRVVRTSLNRKRTGYCYELVDAPAPTPKVNRMAKETTAVADRVKAALVQLGAIGCSVDDRDLRWVEGLLSDARQALQNAAARFERRGIDFPAVQD